MEELMRKLEESAAYVRSRVGTDPIEIGMILGSGLGELANEVEDAEGVSVEVVDLRTLAPLDKEAILDSVRKTGKVLLVNDAHKTGGFIGEIAAMIAESDAFDYLDGRILRLASEDTPIPYNQTLEAAMIPSVERIKKYILKLINKR